MRPLSLSAAITALAGLLMVPPSGAFAEEPPVHVEKRMGGAAARAMEKIRAFEETSCLRPYVSLRGTAESEGLSVDRVKAMLQDGLTRSLPRVPRCRGEEAAEEMAWVNVEVWTVREGGAVAWHVGLRAETEAYDSVFEAAGLGIAPGDTVRGKVRRSIGGLAARFAEAWRVSRGEKESADPRPPTGAKVQPVAQPAPPR